MAEPFETQGVQLPLTWPEDKLAETNASSSRTHDPCAPTKDTSPSPQTTEIEARSRLQIKRSQMAAKSLPDGKDRPPLRPAKDILNRIRHDPPLNVDDFIIGYHDRHLSAIQEIDVSLWKGGGDTTDEEWIPQHRIEYFRRKDEGGRKIWHRSRRLDRLFGSGVQQADDDSDAEEPPPQNESDLSDPEHEELRARQPTEDQARLEPSDEN